CGNETDLHSSPTSTFHSVDIRYNSSIPGIEILGTYAALDNFTRVMIGNYTYTGGQWNLFVETLSDDGAILEDSNIVLSKNGENAVLYWFNSESKQGLHFYSEFFRPLSYSNGSCGLTGYNLTNPTFSGVSISDDGLGGFAYIGNTTTLI